MRLARNSLLAGMAAALALAACAPAPASAAALPAPAIDAPRGGGDQVVVLSGGCFWGIQGVFQHVKGVKSAVSGYAGGTRETADYETVSSGRTGHAESVRIVYDPSQVSFGTLLRIFFSVGTDPTQLNQQFPDDGPQYRNEIWFSNADQERVATAYIRQLDAAHAFRNRIVTRVEPLSGFFPAEGYHQDYLTLHPDSPYIAHYDMPKIADLQRDFPTFYRANPVLVGRRG
jgi:peptide-methionine (S)-S-oxide reductase